MHPPVFTWLFLQVTAKFPLKFVSYVSLYSTIKIYLKISCDVEDRLVPHYPRCAGPRLDHKGQRVSASNVRNLASEESENSIDTDSSRILAQESARYLEMKLNMDNTLDLCMSNPLLDAGAVPWIHAGGRVNDSRSVSLHTLAFSNSHFKKNNA